MRALVVAAFLGSALATDEARVSVDARDAPAVEVITVLARAGDFQPVFDPGITCSLTLKLDQVSWRASLDHVLRACGLGLEEDGTVLRVAPRERLRTESEERRRLAEALGVS
jgi:type II secretory pathway component HofQ